MNNNYDLPTAIGETPSLREELSVLPYEKAEETYALAELNSLRDKLRTALVKQAMDNTAMLAAVEATYNQLAPTGKDEYRLIVRAYARMALTEIIRGDL